MNQGESILQCFKCHHVQAEGSKFCTNCGSNLEKSENEIPELKFCPGCGNKKENAVNFCTNCGFNYVNQTVASETAASLDTSIQRPFYTDSQPVSTGTLSASYASFGQRVAASIIDVVLTFVFGLVIGFIFFPYGDGSSFLGFVFGLVYKAGMESSSMQGTLGKKAVGLQVIDAQGNRISFSRALGRYFAAYLSAILLGIGYLMALFTGKRQTLHDMMAGTYVIKH
jgi:uncharacterized RDD family membrane protein YckC